MKFLIIYHSPLDSNFDEIHSQIAKFKQSYRINHSTWLVQSDHDTNTIKAILSESMGIRDHIIVFELAKKWAISNDVDLIDWLSTLDKHV